MLHSSLVMNNIRNGKQVPEPAAVSGSTESFCYHDRLLPPGWYVKIDKKQVAEYSYEVETSFYSPEGAMLTSLEQVAAYMSVQFSVDTIGHRPPVPLSQMPWRDEINQQSATNPRQQTSLLLPGSDHGGGYGDRGPVRGLLLQTLRRHQRGHYRASATRAR